MHRPKSNRPAKHKRALLESNPPRDNWIEGDEIKTVSTFGEAKTSPNQKLETFYFRAEPCLKNSPSDGRERLELTTKNQWQSTYANGKVELAQNGRLEGGLFFRRFILNSGSFFSVVVVPPSVSRTCGETLRGNSMANANNMFQFHIAAFDPR